MNTPQLNPNAFDKEVLIMLTGISATNQVIVSTLADLVADKKGTKADEELEKMVNTVAGLQQSYMRAIAVRNGIDPAGV